MECAGTAELSYAKQLLQSYLRISIDIAGAESTTRNITFTFENHLALVAIYMFPYMIS